MLFLHCFSHVFNVFALSSQFFILHFVWSSRSPHLSSGADGGAADGGGASHRPQVFSHCFFSSSEYFFLHFDFLQVKSFAMSAHLSSGAGGAGEGGGQGDGSGGGGEAGAHLPTRVPVKWAGLTISEPL